MAEDRNGQLCSRPVKGKLGEAREGLLIPLHFSLPFLDKHEHLALLLSLVIVYIFM